MVKFFYIMMLFFVVSKSSFAGTIPTINYTFQDRYPLRVNVSFKTKDTKKTDLLWGFISYDYVEDLSGDLKNLRRSLSIDSENAVIAKKYLFWDDYGIIKVGSFLIQSMQVSHLPIADISLTYDIPQINYFRSKKGSQYLPPLMLPEVMTKTTEDVRINLNWKELVEDGNTIFTFTIEGKVFVSQKGNHNVSVVMPAKNVMSTYFLVVKKNDLMCERFSIGRAKFRTFAVGMDHRSFVELNNALKRIINSQMEDLHELEEHKEYNVIFLEDDKARVSYYNDFSKTLTMYPNKNINEMKHLIGHEFLHRVFVRNKLNFAKDVALHDPDSFWFIEGFNDYLTRDINMRNGIISEEEYINNINETIRIYLKKQRSYPCKAYNADLATLHGELLALQVDSKLKFETNGTYNLSKLISDLVKNKAGTGISAQYIDDLVFRSSGKKILLSKLLNRSLKNCIKKVGLELPEYIIGGKYRLQEDSFRYIADYE